MYYSFDDIYTTDFIFDSQKRMISFSFDYYFDNNQKKHVTKPCHFVIKNWTSIQIDEEYNKKKCNSFVMKNKFIWNTKDETAYMEDSFVMPNLALILEMKQEGNSLFIYAMSYDNKYFYIKVIDAHIFLDLVDMTKNINVYKSVDDIKDFQQKDVFVAKIASVNHKEELLSELKTHVHIPPHITCNWDAMPKLLYEPFWIGKPLVIVHDDISNLPKSDMEIYKNVITYCKLHTLHTFFVFNDRDYFSIIN